MKKVTSISKQEALTRLMKLCSRSEKSASEIEKKLKNWGLEQYIQEIITHLRNENYLNDTRYAKAFVHDKIHFNKWGRIKIRYHLKYMGIPADIIDRELHLYDDQAYREMIFDELKKKKVSLDKLSLQKVQLKLFAFGKQRGYETDYIRAYIDEQIRK